ncbi:MAG: superoxide dismutase family protein, partial [Deltaproteobacteria bacterium]|nr:superoxide dismutase family protein [Deltaproteobacteria bacterium]
RVASPTFCPWVLTSVDLAVTAGPHGGDLPNITVGADGKAKVEAVAKLVTLKEGEKNSLFQAGGTSLVIHAAADDNVTDPAGNAGARIACGVITR